MDTINETRRNFVELNKERRELIDKVWKLEDALGETSEHIFEVVRKLQIKNKNPEIIKYPKSSIYSTYSNVETDMLDIHYNDRHDDDYYNFKIPIEVIVSDEAINEWFNGLVKDWKENREQIEVNKKMAEEKRLTTRKSLYEKLKKEFEN